MLYKDYIAKQFVGKHLHITCDCIISLDVKGICVGYEIKSNEIIYIIDVNGKNIHVGENTPKLNIHII